jgi:hypothetical protein
MMAFKILKGVKIGYLIQTRGKVPAVTAGKTPKEMFGFQLVRAEERMVVHTGTCKYQAVKIGMFGLIDGERQ